MSLAERELVAGSQRSRVLAASRHCFDAFDASLEEPRVHAVGALRRVESSVERA